MLSSYAVPTITALHRAPQITVRGSTGLLGPGSMRLGAFLSRGCGRRQAQNKGVLNKCRMFAIKYTGRSMDKEKAKVVGSQETEEHTYS